MEGQVYTSSFLSADPCRIKLIRELDVDPCTTRVISISVYNQCASSHGSGAITTSNTFLLSLQLPTQSTKCPSLWDYVNGKTYKRSSLFCDTEPVPNTASSFTYPSFLIFTTQYFDVKVSVSSRIRSMDTQGGTVKIPPRQQS